MQRHVIRRVLLVVVACGLCLLIWWLGKGCLTGKAVFAVWFGVACTFGGPLILAGLWAALRPPQSPVIEDLARLPRIQQMIAEAETQEEKVRLLEGERANLEDVIRAEAERMTILRHRDQLELESRRLLDELQALDEELKGLAEPSAGGIGPQAIARLRDRIEARRDGDYVIRGRGRALILSRSLMDNTLLGWLVILCLDTIYFLRRPD